MELTKEEMKKVIAWLEDYYVSSYKPEDFPDDIDDLPTNSKLISMEESHESHRQP
jgi:hypothetical protein